MNLYTCKHYYPNLLIIVVTLIPIAIGVFFLLNFKNQHIKDTKRLLTEAVVFITIGIVFLLIYIFSYMSSYHHIFLAKDSDDLQTVEGPLTELTTTDFFEGRSDTFRVNGMEFFVSANPLSPGYHKPVAYGGVLNREGMNVRISYIEYDNNRYIMSIDLIEE